jgi:FHA domain
VLPPEIARRRIARTLNSAYADGLLSDDTFVERVEQLLTERLVHPRRLIGDLRLRPPRTTTSARVRDAVSTLFDRFVTLLAGPDEDDAAFLGLDWSGNQEELLVGRHSACDVVLLNPSVSRQHARLIFRAGGWVVQDLGSTNGTFLNGIRVGRAELRPGDRLLVGCESLRVD